MPTIFLLGFRGTGGVTNQKHRRFSEHALIRAGHVAIGGVIPDVFIGFSPTPKAVNDAGGEMELLELLKQHIAQPGYLQDDTKIFHRAKELATNDNEPTTVYKLELEVSDETVETIKKWYNEKTEAMYNFPNWDGTFEPNEYNCGIFPALLGVPTPSDSGSTTTYVEAMEQKGATKW